MLRCQHAMQWLDLTLPTIAENLALDEALLLAAEHGQGDAVLRVWELPHYAVVVGSGGCVAADVNREACLANGVPIARRSSGGGTVLLGPGCLCFSLVLSYQFAPGLTEIPASNRYILGRILNALASVVAGSIQGTSDLAIANKKFSGNAQQRKRTHFLHHGTLLCHFDLAMVPRYLHLPQQQPEYRHNRSHTDFLTNLSLRVADVKQRLVTEWQPQGEYQPLPWRAIEDLMAEKYSRAEWNHKR
ncbi:MAG: lipoate--protein ligase family protein [Gemmataceae bacterium]|nr:lipoate--protein ligase family protein [Gemmata sp.]MDW8198810.1 lipoate--protein ligase family protein [Gemmataceae bacterium]